jgi:hypothetical protein
MREGAMVGRRVLIVVDAILAKPRRLADLEAVIGGLARSRAVRRPSGGAGRRDDDPGAIG